MTIALYDISVASYVQVLEGVSGFLEKARLHLVETGADPDAVVEERLAPDMHPFRFQVQQVAFHSQGAVEAIMSGELNLPGQRPALDYAGLQALIVDAIVALRAVKPEDIEARMGAEVVFHARGTERRFTAEGFVGTFSLPNFHFHASMAYAILRARGAPLGKFDFMGQLRLKS
jgi:hypothetical protein